jgi:CHAT domain-containing protein
MKNWLLFILVLFCLPAFSQDDSDFLRRAKEGQLSYEECMAVDFSYFSQIVPSMLNLKRKYERADMYNGALYNNIVLYLHSYYMRIGDIASSRMLLNEAANTFNKRESEPNNQYFRQLLTCRGQLELSLKNYGDALNYLNLAHQYFEEKNDYGDSYLVMLLDMALSYIAIGDLLSAKIYMDEAVEQFEKSNGSIYEIKDENQFIMLADYGYILHSIGHDKEAERCFLGVINNSKNNSISHEAYALATNNLSAMYMKQGRWSDAASLLERLKSENNENNYMFAQNLALCYLYTKDYPKAISSLQDMNRYSLSNIETIFSSFTGIERENYWTTISKERIFINNLIAYHSNASQAVCTAYNNALFTKGLLINSSRIIDQFVNSSTDAELRRKYETYKQLRSKLAYKTDNRSSRDSLAREIIDIERDILQVAGSLGKWLSEKSKTWIDVQRSLGGNEVAIEYCYAPQMETYPDVKPFYGAFVLRKDFDSPKLIPLENVDSVEEVFDNDNADELFINDLYASRKAVTLHHMLWEKLSPYLKGVKTVYYSPTGPLSNVNFEVLRGDDGVMLNEKFQMVRISSTANIREVKAASTNIQTSVLYGNIDYDESEEEMRNASIAYHSFSGTEIQSELALRSLTERGAWGGLPSTKKEIDYIHSLLTKQGVKVAKLEESNANEESFKSLGGKSPELIHLATHGFVIDTKKKAEGNKFVASTSVYSNKDSYMMWSGLMLAGGNNIWRGNFNQSNVEDGILTADEISRMDLSNTKLVVLSACETAKGKVDPVDGVYGLQRAFKMAGVETIVMSLWKVQDDATSMLMTQFYTYLTSGVEKHQALWKAMMDVRAKYKDPYYWAGFVMLD